jgi:hypothetical protein
MLALGSMGRSTCPPSLPSRLPSGKQPSAHARLSDEVSDNRHGQQWTSADGLSQARRAATLAVRVCTWLRDEEAAGSNPAIPT